LEASPFFSWYLLAATPKPEEGDFFITKGWNMQRQITLADFGVDEDFWIPGENERKFQEEEAKEKAQKRQERTDRCGCHATSTNPFTGNKDAVRQWCKNYDICAKCAAFKRRQEEKKLKKLIGKKLLENVPVEEEKEIVKKYGKENVKRIPIGKDKTTFVVETEDDIGRELEWDDCERIAEEYEPGNGRRCSGSLGVDKPEPTEEEQDIPPGDTQEKSKQEEIDKRRHLTEEFIEDMDWDAPQEVVETISTKVNAVHLEKATHPKAPKTIQQFWKLVQEAVNIKKSPETYRELQDALDLMDITVQETCHNYGIPILFLYTRHYESIDLREVNWKWVKPG
jgi:hypothetical protein